MFVHVPHNLPVLLREDGPQRRYVTPTGEKYVSVTTVLADYNKQSILEWRKKVGEEKANKISRTATTRGSGVHKAIETLLNNEDVSTLEMMPNVKSLYVRMKEELVKKVNNIHCLETPLYSHKLKLAGTVDCIAEHEGVLSVIDFKTSNRLKKKENIGNYFMQCVAYADMFTELTGTPIEQVVVLIGVDAANFCQTMKVKGEELNIHRNNLKTYIENFYDNVDNSVNT